MSVENTQRDDETTVLPVADEEQTTVLPAAEVDASEHSAEVDAEQASATMTDEAGAVAENTGRASDSGANTGAVPGSDSASTPLQGPSAATPRPSTPGGPATSGVSVPTAKEPPANGVRVAQLVWAGLVIMLGIFMIAISFLRFVSIPLLLISLIAALGVALMAAAVVTSVRKG